MLPNRHFAVSAALLLVVIALRSVSSSAELLVR